MAQGTCCLAGGESDTRGTTGLATELMRATNLLIYLMIPDTMETATPVTSRMVLVSALRALYYCITAPCVVGWGAPPPKTPLTFFPISEIRPGLKGIGKTVFSGTTVEEFQVEVLGVLENAGPKQSIILARLSG